MKVLYRNGGFKEKSFEEKEGKEAFWHTGAHVLAQAVKRLYPDTKCATGSATENGFYHDFEFNFKFTEENLNEVEKEMYKIVKEALSLQVISISRKEALEFMEERGETYKTILIKDLPEDEEVTFYKQGSYTGFCKGPHISNTCHIKALKLLKIAGAYWQGDENNKMLVRLYGISFPKHSLLEEYLKVQEEAKLRDHRKLGKELGLFTLMEEAPGFPFFLPNGIVLKDLLTGYWKKIHKREGYEMISTPILLKQSLWETSGHWEHYHDIMYTTLIDGENYAVKPMSCPSGILVYKMRPRSYKDLPMRLGELGIVHRNEKSGQLHGLMRVRCFTQDDAHIFMTEEQVIPEI